jgi:hypothetical protein
MFGPFDILRGNELDLQLVSQSSTGNMWQGYQKSYISVSDVYRDFVLIIKPHTHELYILRHWTNIVDIQDCCKVIRVCLKYWMSCP